MIPVRNFLPQETRCWGCINGKAFELEGGGAGWPFEGVVSTKLQSKTGVLEFPVALLSPVLIMGYPTYSTYHVGAFDLFKLSDGYEYVRRFRFENGEEMNTQHKVMYGGDSLAGEFEVLECSLTLPDITSGDATVETFYPLGPGRLGSIFSMAWFRHDGGLFRCVVESEYKLTHNASLPYQQFRFIRFETETTNSSIRQTERLNVVRDLDKVHMGIVNSTYSREV